MHRKGVHFIETPADNKYLVQIKQKIGVCYGFFNLHSQWVEERIHLLKQKAVNWVEKNVKSYCQYGEKE